VKGLNHASHCVRTCPDCRGKGRIWVPLCSRHQITDVTYLDTTNLGECLTTPRFHEELLPEYRECRLCAGSGKIKCYAAEAAKGGK